MVVLFYLIFGFGLPLNAIARHKRLVLHSQVRGVEVCGSFDGGDGQDDVVD